MKKILISLGVIIAIVLLFIGYRTFLAPDIYVMSGLSMVPTYVAGDILIISKDLSNISRGTVVDFTYISSKGANVELIKRIVGLPGEKIQIKNGQVYINDILTEIASISSVIDSPASKTKGSLTNSLATQLGSNQYYVLGDNTSQSLDSRDFGAVDHNQINVIIIGKN